MSDNTTDSIPVGTPTPKKKALITFINYERDSFEWRKRQNSDFLYRHRLALKIKKYLDEDNWLNCTDEELREKLQRDGKNILKVLARNDIWRPTVALAMGFNVFKVVDKEFPKLHFDLMYIFHQPGNHARDTTTEEVLEDIKPHIKDIVQINPNFKDPYQHAEVYRYLYKEFQKGQYHQNDTEYYVNIFNGTSAIRSCLFLLTQERVLDAKRIIPLPWPHPQDSSYKCVNGTYQLQDPAEFETIYEELRQEGLDQSVDTMNRNIETDNQEFKHTLRQIANVALRTHNPILLTGPTGAGKTQIAKNIYELLKKPPKECSKPALEGEFQHINCATLAGDANITKTTLFGQKKDSHSTATEDKPGALALANHGILFLDEVGTLGAEEQAMLLTAIETKKFRPLGGTQDEESDFMLICGTNADLWEAVEKGEFRRDLFERINLWHFDLPSLHDRRDEIMHQCELFRQKTYPNNMTKRYGEKRKHEFLKKFENEKVKNEFKAFIEEEYEWPGNFRELNGILERMFEMSVSNVITSDVVQEEITRTRELRKKALRSRTAKTKSDTSPQPQPDEPPKRTKLQTIIDNDEVYKRLSPQDRVQLEYLADNCHRFTTLKEMAKDFFGYDDDAGEPKDMGLSTMSRTLNKFGLTFKNRQLMKRSGK